MTPGARPELGRLVDTLANVDRPASIHTWKRNPEVQYLLRSLGDRTLTFDHTSFDAVRPGRTREHLRQLLIHEGLLPNRDPDLVRFEDWLATKLVPITDPAVLHPLEQFTRWHHLARIRSKSRSGHDTSGPVHSAKQEITESLRFLNYLAEQQTTLKTCTQADLDSWLATGPTTRHTIRTFIRWTVRNGPRHDPPATPQQPPHLLGRPSLLAAHLPARRHRHPRLPRRRRPAAPLRQPLARITSLRTEHVIATPQGLFLRFGNDPAPLPELFAAARAAEPYNRYPTTANARIRLSSPGQVRASKRSREILPNRTTEPRD
jgi:hypothetical protein